MTHETDDIPETIHPLQMGRIDVPKTKSARVQTLGDSDVNQWTGCVKIFRQT